MYSKKCEPFEKVLLKVFYERFALKASCNKTKWFMKSLKFLLDLDA